MYLKSIEVYGFKSFANRIKFDFGSGITGIVGPNGSGKSNVADAVRWVLGEQSAKQLRGANMQDVIFSGTQMRKPLSSAFVAITFDNSDHQLNVEYDEVTVARRVYRSGESEYRLNGNICRLKEMQELFYDTGIGKDGYSIIGQGQIDRILSGKPEERRELFDEAAGIVKYKRRKLTAEKSLEEEKANLARVDDIISELEGQLKPLGEQSEKARQYLDYKEKLKKLEINQFLVEAGKIEELEKEQDSKISNVSRELENAKNEYEASKQEYHNAEEEIEQAGLKIDEVKAKKDEVYDELNRAVSEKSLCEEKITGINGLKVQNKDRLNTVTDSVKEKEAALNKAGSDGNIKKEQLKKANDDKEELEKKLEATKDGIRELSENIDAEGKKVIKALKDAALIKEDIAHAEALREQNVIRKAQISNELLTNKSEADSIQAKNEKASANLKLLSTRIEETKKELVSLDETLKDLKEKQTDYTQELSVKNKELLSKQTKLDYTKNMSERYEGFGSSIKRVMEEKKNIQGILGVVADIIQTDPKYEVAVEIALGGGIQNIVTDNEATAQKLIEILKREKAGRATFLPLTGIVPSPISVPEALKEPGAINTADNLVKAEGRFIILARFLLGRTLVVDNLNNAIAISRKYKQKLKIVTIDGELINPGGAISGGTYRNTSNLLGRKREIEELDREVSELSKAAAAINHKIADITENVNNSAKKTEMLKSRLSELAIEENTTKIEAAGYNNELNKLSSGFEKLKKESDSIDISIIELKRTLEEKNRQHDELINTNSDSELNSGKLNEELNDLRTQDSEIRNLLSEVTASITGINSDLMHIMQNSERLSGEIGALKAERTQLEEALKKSDTDLADIESNIRSLKDKQITLTKEIKEIDLRLAEMGKERQDKQEANKALFEKHDAMNGHISDLEKELVRLEAQKEKIADNFDSLTGYLWEEYNLTPSDAENYRDEEITASYPKNKSRINELKSDIKALGDVNVAAIEQYREVNERYTFLTKQHDDLTEATDKLVLLINELVDSMRKQFSEKFADIKREFNNVFKELFGGGTGDIELVDSDNILETDITISATPPGKKLTNMMQLSGGEKALTAIALLFAILNLKPSPFCLLDEIEAALDDSNVKRFADYLHKLTKSTQFIVITHRRGTMNAADCLYGITMQEKGVSTLVSVSLIEDRLDDSTKN